MSASQLSFLKEFKKSISKMENVNLDARPPSHWYSSGNLAINRIISGSYRRGMPQGRVTAFVGPSDSGKSYILSCSMKAAQDDGAFILAIDSENALDYNYLRRVGVDIGEDKFLGIGVVTVQDLVEVVSEFISGYLKEHGKYNRKAPKVMIAIDSLSMLLTESENENFDKGDQKGDQGQQAKQIKHFLKTMTSRMKQTNMFLAATAHVYAADPLKGEGMYAVTPSLRYACSQIVLITKLLLREDAPKPGQKVKEVLGIKLKATTFKSRFARIGSFIEVEVPYDAGLDKYEGLLELAKKDELITQGGAWYTLKYDGIQEIKFMEKNMTPEIAEAIINHPKMQEIDALFDSFNDEEEEVPEEQQAPLEVQA